MKKTTLLKSASTIKIEISKALLLLCLISITAFTGRIDATSSNVGTEAGLRNAAVTSAANGDVITLTQDIVITSQLAITKSITIYGSGFTISVTTPGLDDMGRVNSSPSTYRAFSISGNATVTFSGLKIKGGMLTSGQYGAGLLVNSGSTMNLTSCVISNSRAYFDGENTTGGGGIVNYGTTYLQYSLITRNAGNFGGGFVNGSGATMFVESSTFSENQSTGYNGGGGAGENQGKLYVNNSTISNNQSSEIGGGINNFNGTLYLVNTSVTGNVAYGADSKGGGIGNNGGFVYAANTLFAHNYLGSGDQLNPTSYSLDDINAYSGQANLYLYYCIYHASLPSGTNNVIGNIQYGGLPNGSNNTIFSGGSLSKITNGIGNYIGTASVFRPFLYNNAGSVAPTLKVGSFLLAGANKGTQTRFAKNSNVNPMAAYYNRTTSTWVNLPLITGTSSALQLIDIDQVYTSRANPPVVGAIETATLESLYMLRVNVGVGGTVTGGSIYGDVYKSKTVVSLTAIPSTGFTFVRWDYVSGVGGTGMASTANPYDVTVDKDITLVPVFSGDNIWTGALSTNWGTPGNWLANYVPNASQPAIIPLVTNNPTVNEDIISPAVCSYMVIEPGAVVTIAAGKALVVSTDITNNAGVTGIVVKSDPSLPNGTLIFHNNQLNPVLGSVEMYSKAFRDTYNHWQYFGIPVQSTTVGTTFTSIGPGASQVREYYEGNHDATGNDLGLWQPAGTTSSLASGYTLSPTLGYEVVQPAATTYTFKGTLNNTNTDLFLPYTTGADWAGNNIISNPFTAALDINNLLLNSYLAENSVYIYNTGSREEWTANSGSGTPGQNPGTYSVSTGEFAGIFDVPAQIPSMQGFLVKTALGGGFMPLTYSSVVAGSKPQRSKAQSSSIVGTRIDVLGATSSDRLWIFSGSEYKRGFDNGFDGRKMIVEGASQLYAVEEDGEYQIDAVNTINNTNLAFQPKANGTYKLVIAHQNASNMYSKIYLVDLKENTTTDITADGTEYNFSSSTTDAVNRFKIVTTTTGLSKATTETNFAIVMNNSILVNNESSSVGSFIIYSTNGKILLQERIPANTNVNVSTTELGSGVYIGKLKTESKELTQRLIIR